MMKYPGTDLQTYNLDWVIQEVKRLAKANGIEFNDENIHIGTDNVQEAIDALYDLIMEISSQTNAVEVIDSSIVESTWSSGNTYTHLQTVNTPTLMAIINAMRLGKAIILRRDIATNDEAAFVLLEVTYDPILFKHELKLVNPYLHKIATLDIFGLDDDANVYVQILPDVTVKYVNTFNGRSGNIIPQTSDYDAVQVDYNNAGSGLAATNVQDALDEIKGDIPTTFVETFNGRSGAVNPDSGDYNAGQITYDNTTSGLSATDTQGAIDELVANPVMPDAVDVPYNNIESGLQATNVQAALDEIVDDVLSSGVASFNGRTGAVNPDSGDYNAGQITYSNTTSDLSATDAQGAIDELASDIEDLSDVTPQTSTGNPISIATDAAQVARDTKITLNPIQAAGTPTPSDPIPIYGRDSIEFTVTKKNLFNPDDVTENVYISDVDGVQYSEAGSAGSGYIPVSPNTNYIITTVQTAHKWGAIYDSNKIFIQGLVATDFDNGFTTPVNACYVRLTVSYNSSDYKNTFQLELGASATAYEAFTASTDISLPLPSTVYGGELDVETGVLTVDRILSAQVVPASAGSGIEGHTFNNAFPYPVKSEGYGNNNPNYKCNVTTYAYDGSDTYNHWYASGGTTAILFLEAQPSDLTVQFTAELVTPIEIQLTPYEVALLHGANVITSNGSSITLVWREGTVATLEDIPVETVNKIAGLMVTQTAGELNGKISANQEAAAVLSNVMLRSIKIQTTAVTPGDDASEPDGTLIIVYEA